MQNTTLCFLYDGTFEGLLSAVFDAFSRKQFPELILREERPLLFAEFHTVVTDAEKSERVLQGLQKKLSKYAVEMLFTCFLSEIEEVEGQLFSYMCKTFRSTKSIELNFADPDVLALSKMYKKVKREAEKMKQFVRFQKTADGVFFAYIEPLYNVLPCVSDFFEDRFADPEDAALLQSAGVRVTRDVHSYEEAKLRMLNGSHTAMALMGAVTGRPFIASCIGVPHIREFVFRLMGQEVAPHLSRSDWADYRTALIARFGNPYLKHSVHQIATDSSQKIPQRWPPSVLGQIGQGAAFEHHALAAAVFVRYTLGVDEQGQAYALNDPQAQSLMALGAAQRTTPEACVRALLVREDLWGSALPQDAAWIARVTHWHQHILQHGVDHAVQQLTGA